MAKWRSDLHEKLAESVEICTWGGTSPHGIKTVPKSQCPALLATYKAAVKAVRR